MILNVLITDLNQSKYLSVVSQDRIFSIFKNLGLDNTEKYSSGDLEAISKRCRVSSTVTGSYYTPGEKFIFNTSFKNLQTEETITFSEEGEDETKVPDIIDRISLRIKSELGLSQEQIASDTDEKAGMVRSYSPDALKYFSQGEKFYNHSEYEKALTLFEAAVAADPNIPMAYANLALMHWFRAGRENDDPNFTQNLEKAFSLSDRASEKERLIIHGLYYFMLREDYEKTESILLTLVEKYPDEVLGYRRLGYIYGNFGNLKKAREYYEKAYRVRPENQIDAGNLETVLNYYPADFERAEEVMLDFIERFPEITGIRLRLVWNYRDRGKYELALSELDELFRIAPDGFSYPLIRAWIYAYKGDLIQAEGEIQKSIDSDNLSNKNEGIMNLAYLRLYQGRKKEALDFIKQSADWYMNADDTRTIINHHLRSAIFNLANDNPESALEECEAALSLAEEKNHTLYKGRILYRKGTCLVAMNEFEKTADIAENLRQYLETGINLNRKRMYPMLLGQIEFARGNYSRAIELIEKAINQTDIFNVGQEVPRDEYIYSLAEAYYRSGNLEKAKIEFSKIDSLAKSPGNHNDLIGMAIFKLGKINEEQGDKAKAIENYEKFLGLWKDADLGLPEVDDARTRLSALKTQ